ncbi:LPS export ABC transporter periplasmic protein LptC [Caulobacter sp. 17J65-9]|uniref:LPS export ABC transporter periplasmic protein LptC n=1 Tax=Caulobacter sp. 17J65-9 TaxID=2709382 RepID=UPI0013CD635A|nr:LPS export ABC transporter periplasmic protein LptC [Caulobacter sp. 17J65-9]
MTEPLPPLDDRQEDAERVHRAMHAWRRRSQLIHFFRKALPAGIAATLIALLGWVGIKQVLLSLESLRVRDNVVRMVNPRFYGQDDKGRAYVLGAREAQRGGGEQIRLDDPMLRLGNMAGKPTELTAQKGYYDEKNRSVRLTGDVQVKDAGSGFHFKTGEAKIDTRSGVISGNAPIQGQGPLGQISASSYAIYDQGARVVFKGGVRARLEQRGRPAAGNGGPR